VEGGRSFSGALRKPAAWSLRTDCPSDPIWKVNRRKSDRIAIFDSSPWHRIAGKSKAPCTAVRVGTISCLDDVLSSYGEGRTGFFQRLYGTNENTRPVAQGAHARPHRQRRMVPGRLARAQSPRWGRSIPVTFLSSQADVLPALSGWADPAQWCRQRVRRANANAASTQIRAETTATRPAQDSPLAVAMHPKTTLAPTLMKATVA
jgi:hypothetical protein